MKLQSEKDHSRQNKRHAPGVGAGEHGLFEKLRDVLDGQMVKNKEEPIRVETGKVIQSLEVQVKMLNSFPHAMRRH